jgi:hypothetical protein
MATTPKLYEAACKGTHLPNDDGSDENFVYGGPENADSVTGAGDPSAPMDSGNNLKQLGIALHALDAGDCSVDICAQNSPSASPAPDNSRGYTAGHFALELEGHNASPTVDYGTGSFIIANVGDPAPVDYGTGSFIIQNVSDPATIDASLVFDSTGGGGRSTVLLPYIEQHGGEADDGGFVINWTTTGDGPKGGDTVGVIAIITPTEHGGSVLEFSVENFPNNSQSGPGDERLASFCATGQTSGDGSNQGIIIDWTSGDGSSHDAFPTETIFPTETVHPMESVHALYDLVV